MSRLPIRLRVTLVFAAAMALLLAALGIFIYERFRADLDDSLEEGLRSRAEQVTRQAEQLRRGETAPALVEREESFAQIVSPAGAVLASGAGLGPRPLLAADQIERAAAGAALIERPGPPLIDGAPSRILAEPVRTPRGPAIVAAGASLDDRNDSLASLRRLLLLGGPAALLIASLAGYLAAGTALRPVEAMRRRAAAISDTNSGELLPVPAGNDELSRLGRTLNEMLARLEAALARERTFVDDASHELRTPLALQKAELETSLRYAKSPEELRAAITSAIEEVDRLIRLAEDLLVLARSQDGKLALESSPVEIGPLLAKVRDRFAARAASEARAIRIEADEGATLVGDAARIEQALMNMLDNALRHGAGEITLAAHRSGNGVELAVSDRGSGFPDGFAEHAFERFSRADPARGAGGTGLGLGLAIVEAVARSHGGEARAANGDSGGAEVRISIHDGFIDPA